MQDGEVPGSYSHIYVGPHVGAGGSHVASRQTDETIVATKKKKCPSFTLFSCRRRNQTRSYVDVRQLHFLILRTTSRNYLYPFKLLGIVILIRKMPSNNFFK
jgi:hypothetical protein